jgi:2-methylisocitrate lyase-like PEP mutase family enzyme
MKLALIAVQRLLDACPDINPVAVAMVSLPMLNIVAMGNAVAMEAEKLAGRKAASEVLKTMEERLKNHDKLQEYEDPTLVRE